MDDPVGLQRATGYARATVIGKTRALERQRALPADALQWRCGSQSEWVAAAGQVSLLLDEIEAGRMTATPAEQVALRTFVATVEGMTNGA